MLNDVKHLLSFKKRLTITISFNINLNVGSHYSKNLKDFYQC